MRYIHQNPVKAGMVKRIEDYRWSSYNAYIKNDILIDTAYALDYFRDMKAFMEYMSETNDDKCLEYNPKKRYTDEDLQRKIASMVDISTLNSLDIDTRDKTLKKIKERTGASNRQLSRVLKIGRSILDRIK